MPIHELKLIEQKKIAENTIEFIFEKPTNFHYIPGQYGGFTLNHPDTRSPLTRRFSLLSGPLEPVLRIAIRNQPSDFKKILLALKPADSIKFAGPTGNFILPDIMPCTTIFIAGGIGITPFYSMIRHAVDLGVTNQHMMLFYGNNSLDDAAYLPELSDIANKHSFLKLVPVMQNAPNAWQGERGLITASLIDNYFHCGTTAPLFYVCGSQAMVFAMQRVLTELAIPEQNIRLEDFPGY